MALYNIYIRPHLDFASTVWSPSTKRDSDLLEKIQRRFTRLLPELKGLTYEERLTVLGIKSLEERRRELDLIQCYRFWKDIDYSPDPMFTLEPEKNIQTRRSHKPNFIENHSRLNVRKLFFSQRATRQWNKLPLELQCAPTLESFKRQIKQKL